MPEFHYADVLLAPIYTEKSNDLMMNEGKYVFAIAPKATKQDVARAVTERFNVKVEDVHIINLPRKPKRAGRWNYKTAKRRKAIVKLFEGASIPELSEAL